MRATATRWRRVSATSVIAAGLVLTSCGDDDDQSGGATTSTTTEATTTTTVEATSSTTQPAVAAAAPDQRLWPRPSSDVRFEDPTAAARSFALYHAQIANPVVGEFRPGDARSGEVDVSAYPTSSPTTVLVRQGDDDSWYVVATTTTDITVDQPTAGSTLTCPLAVSGQALAFEGQVNVRIDGFLPDGRRVEAGSGFVMGSGSPPPGPFSGEIACSVPGDVESWGIASFFTSDESSDIGGTLQIVSLPIRIHG